jgi:hypothetical protein
MNASYRRAYSSLATLLSAGGCRTAVVTAEGTSDAAEQALGRLLRLQGGQRACGSRMYDIAANAQGAAGTDWETLVQ